MRLILFSMNGTLLGRETNRAVNALAKAGIELEENEPDIEEAPRGGLANRGF